MSCATSNSPNRWRNKPRSCREGNSAAHQTQASPTHQGTPACQYTRDGQAAGWGVSQSPPVCSEHTDHARTRTADARLDTHSTSSASARRTKTCALAAIVTAMQWSSGACAPRQVQRVSVCRATVRCKLFVGLTPRESTHSSGTSTEACECPCVGRTQPSHWFNPTVKVCDDPMSIRDLETVALTRAKVTLFSSALGSGSACTCHHVS